MGNDHLMYSGNSLSVYNIYCTSFDLNKCAEQGLEVIESTNLKYFTKEMTAEFYALKGMFLAQINKYVQLNKTVIL